MPSLSASASSPQYDGWFDLAAKSLHPMSPLVQDPITYRPPERLAHRQQSENERHQHRLTDHVHPHCSLMPSTPRSLSSSLCSLDPRFPPSPLHTLPQQEALIRIPNPSYFHCKRIDNARNPESAYGEAGGDGCGCDVASPTSGVAPSASLGLRIVVNTSCHPHSSGHDDQTLSSSHLAVHSTSREAESPHSLSSISPASTPFDSQLQDAYGVESEGDHSPMHWREYGLDLFAWADGSWDHLLPSITAQEDGVQPGLSPTSFASSTQAPLSSPPHPNHVTVQHVHTDTLKHIIFEDKSLPETVLNQLFPPSSRRVTRPSSGRGTPGRMWICQLPGCGRSVRRQERVAHALQHRGKNRFTCSCGGSFARSQDKKRHLREQKICANCTRPVGRNGANGCCFMCIQL